jgi:glycosyltransferase involved in cell wall biosynthesis
MDRVAVTALVFVTQKVDEGDPVLGFVPRLVTALSERVEAVTVVANEVVGRPGSFGASVDVVSLGKERGTDRFERLLRFERALSVATRDGSAAILAHMCPAYLNLAAPMAKARGIATLLWFAHPARSMQLRVADRLADAVLTSLPGAYPLRSRKVRVIGQATDVAALEPCPALRRRRALRVVAIGRTSPSKAFDVVIRAAARCREAGLDVHARIVGPSTTPAEHHHRAQLERLVSGSGLDARVTVEPGVPPHEVRDVVCGSDVLVNAMVAGSGDKVVFEAAALGRPVIVSNPAFGGLLRDLPLDLTFPDRSADALAERLQAVAAANASTIRTVTDALRSRVVAEHSIDHWADAVVGIAEALTASRRRAPWMRGPRSAQRAAPSR